MLPIQIALRKLSKPEKIPTYQNFFKTGKGEYAEGDIFIGVTVPDTRKVAQSFISTPLDELVPLLNSKIHEDRMCGLMIIAYKYQKLSNSEEQKKLVDFYLKHRYAANNWDLIDCIVDRILGPWLLDKDKTILYDFAKSSSLWERRMAIISTFHFIKNNKFEDTIKISEILLSDKHDLIHKAVGWMLREMGKRDIKKLESFLKKHSRNMPRTMLRYAIERFPEERRQGYLKGEIK
ncbi:MAG TPA: DNA alkylation repair protein [Candidatus Nanoarchaeia archaeon]|nr:DNA alkylation repair protein [Candidatus Nanoarchaeia archaeon]